MELFTDYWTYGRSLASMPTHNVYVPVTTNIMPRPRFRNALRQVFSGHPTMARKIYRIAILRFRFA